MKNKEFSDAIVAYLQKGQSSFPRSDVPAAKTAATHTNPDILVANVEEILKETMSISVDWSKLNLSEGGHVAREEMARRHPELDNTALDALYWYFTYSMR